MSARYDITGRSVLVIGPVSNSLDLLLQREGLVVTDTGPAATVYGRPPANDPPGSGKPEVGGVGMSVLGMITRRSVDPRSHQPGDLRRAAWRLLRHRRRAT